MRAVRHDLVGPRHAAVARRLAPMWLLLPLACSGDITAPGSSRGDDGAGSDQDGSGDRPGRPGEPGEPIACAEDAIAPRIWRLTPAQYRHTLADAFSLTDFNAEDLPREVADGRTGFPNDAAGSFLNGALTSSMFRTAETVAARVGGNLAKTNACLVGTSVSDDCVRGFLADVGRRAFRRSLEDGELDKLVTFFRGAEKEHKARGAAEMAVQALLMSPKFHYRSELGRDGVLAGWEIASQLSYGITDAPPSPELLEGAERGALEDPEERARVALELATSPRGRAKAADFVHWQMKLHRLENARQELGSAVVDSMLAEPRAFVEEVLASDAPTLATLYAGNFSYVDDKLAPLYGLPAGEKTLARVDLPAEERFGLFTQLGFLNALHGPVHRGRVLRETILCQEIPAPPQDAGDLINQLPETPVEWTEAEKWPVFERERAGCASCHALFQPMGLAFEVYDENGRFRRENEAGRFIDPTGSVSGAEGWSGEFGDARDMIDQFVNSEVAQTCFVRRYTTFLLGREMPGPGDSCFTRDVTRRFVDEGLDLRALVAAVAADPSFVARHE